MRSKPPLTREKLTEIQDRRKDDDDVIALLWEIKRLRALVLRADQLQKSLTPGAGGGIVLEAFRKELEGEPCILEQPKLDL